MCTGAVCGTPAGCPVIDFANIAVHGLNALVMIIDATICRMPFHLAHIFMPMIYAVAYLTFNVIWQVSGNGYVYLVLDWQVHDSHITLFPRPLERVLLSTATAHPHVSLWNAIHSSLAPPHASRP